jgi:two-component system, OmpR family, response regulator
MINDFSDAVSVENKGMRPCALAIIDDDSTRACLIASTLGLPVDDTNFFFDGYTFLADPRLFHHHLYIINLDMEDIPALELVKILRLRSDAGIVLTSQNIEACTLKKAMAAGADRLIDIAAGIHHLPAQVQAVANRLTGLSAGGPAWPLQRPTRQAAAANGAMH